MTVITIANLKGGCGKTTIAGNLAAEFLALDIKVVAVDADPQRSLTLWAGWGEGVLRYLVRTVAPDNRRAFVAAIHKLAREFQLVLIDTPPGFDDPALWSMTLADVVIVPVAPSAVDINAAGAAVELARAVRIERGGKAPSIQLLPIRVIASTRTGRDLPRTLKALGEHVLPAVGQRIVNADAMINGLTVRELGTHSQAQEEHAAVAASILRAIKWEKKKHRHF